MANAIKIDIGIGELVDKITILEIKRARIKSPEKLKNIEHELSLLNNVKAQLIQTTESDLLEEALKQINEKLWDIEDSIRRCESKKQFDETFIELARAVYFTNDKRSDIKRQINQLQGSQIIEEKSYEDYA
jgi:superfamily I DNA and/or RNA helicase